MYKNIIKRLLDILFSLCLLPLSIVFFLLLAPFIYFEDKGNIFYSSERIGKFGKIFKMYKLRTMKVGATDIRNDDGSTFNSSDDPRMTKCGKILRQTGLDELPQLFNIIMGDMSFIGPRPDLPDHLVTYSPTQKKKLRVLPGISGYNQAYFRNSIKWSERIINDVYYVEKLSFIFDLKILLKTVRSVFSFKDVYNIRNDEDNGK